MINFKASKKDAALIIRIANRAMAECNLPCGPTHLMMDITAVHLNDTKLDLDRLLQADEFNFMHDIYGIYSHLNRKTGKLKNCFLSRCARPEIIVTAAKK